MKNNKMLVIRNLGLLDEDQWKELEEFLEHRLDYEIWNQEHPQ